MEFKTNWSSADYYNPEDLNRVEEAIKETAQLIKDLLGIDVGLEPTVTNRDYSRIEYAEDLNRIERNIEKLFVLDIQGLIGMKTNWGAVEPESFSYVDANRLEHNLSLLYPIFDKNSRNINYCGTFACGEDVI